MKRLVISPKTLGSTIREQRKARGFTQHDVMERFQVQQKTLSDIENGAGGTRLSTLLRVLAALDLELVIQSKVEKSNISDDEQW